MQRRFELKTKSLLRDVQNLERRSNIDFEGFKARLALVNSKTFHIQSAFEFLTLKMTYISQTQTFYSKQQIKEIKFLRYKLSQKSDFNFLKRFWKAFGNNCAVFIGNWSEVSICIYN